MLETLVWLEMRPAPRLKWAWWGWKRIGDKPLPAEQQKFFASVALAPYVMDGFQIRLRKA